MKRLVVIVAGGGGIPVVRQPDGELLGVEAVVDKDYTASLVARELGADLLVVLTGVPQVMRDFGTPQARPLSLLPAAEARSLLAEGQFPPGSMGPKLEAALDFVASTGRRVLITDLAHLSRAMAGEAGTAIVP